jgi:hypothetical protein
MQQASMPIHPPSLMQSPIPGSFGLPQQQQQQQQVLPQSALHQNIPPPSLMNQIISNNASNQNHPNSFSQQAPQPLMSLMSINPFENSKPGSGSITQQNLSSQSPSHVPLMSIPPAASSKPNKKKSFKNIQTILIIF